MDGASTPPATQESSITIVPIPVRENAASMKPRKRGRPTRQEKAQYDKSNATQQNCISAAPLDSPQRRSRRRQLGILSPTPLLLSDMILESEQNSAEVAQEIENLPNQIEDEEATLSQPRVRKRPRVQGENGDDWNEATTLPSHQQYTRVLYPSINIPGPVLQDEVTRKKSRSHRREKATSSATGSFSKMELEKVVKCSVIIKHAELGWLELACGICQANCSRTSGKFFAGLWGIRSHLNLEHADHPTKPQKSQKGFPETYILKYCVHRQLSEIEVDGIKTGKDTIVPFHPKSKTKGKSTYNQRRLRKNDTTRGVPNYGPTVENQNNKSSDIRKLSRPTQIGYSASIVYNSPKTTTVPYRRAR
jgi:hypothetical protein